MGLNFRFEISFLLPLVAAQSQFYTKENFYKTTVYTTNKQVTKFREASAGACANPHFWKFWPEWITGTETKFISNRTPVSCNFDDCPPLFTTRSEYYTGLSKIFGKFL